MTPYYTYIQQLPLPLQQRITFIHPPTETNRLYRFPCVLFGGWRVAFRFLLLLLPFFGHAWKMFEYTLEMFIIFHCVIGISRNGMFCTRNGIS